MLTWRFITMSVKSAIEHRADFFFMILVGAIWLLSLTQTDSFLYFPSGS